MYDISEALSSRTSPCGLVSLPPPADAPPWEFFLLDSGPQEMWGAYNYVYIEYMDQLTAPVYQQEPCIQANVSP